MKIEYWDSEEAEFKEMIQDEGTNLWVSPDRSVIISIEEE
jgi:hypothetical protein